MTYYDDLKPLIDKAAIATVRKWPAYVSAEDVQQELWLWAHEKETSVRSAMKMDGWEAKVYSTMVKVASTAASTEDQQTNGYSKEDTYIYSAAVLETLLESCFTYEDWQSFGTFGDGQPHAKGQVNETGDVLAMLSDIKAGLATLKAEYREVLFYRFGMHWTEQKIADEWGATRNAIHNRSGRAVKALQAALGHVDITGLRERWDDRREILGNERSQIMTNRLYEG